jgi:Concanavalin A-like lectin/glucanases superfamily/EGF-like domain
MSTGAFGGEQRYSLLQFDLSGIPSGQALAALHAASVSVSSAYIVLALSSAPSGAGTVNVHQVTSAWSQASATWNSAPTWNPAVAASFPIPAGTAANTTLPSINLTSLAKAWATGAPNDGLLLEEPGGQNATFYDSESSDFYQRPQLTLIYTLKCLPGYQDCDNNEVNGCETNAAGDANNCGACGNVCPAGNTCQNSVCVANPCANVVCTPVDACHAAGVCNPANGQCGAGASLADTATGLAHRWAFDEASGSVAVDSAGGDNGALGSSTARITSFDGSGAVLIAPDARCDLSAQVNFGTAPGAFGAGDFTVSYWVASNFTGAGNGTGAGDLIGNRQDPSGGDYFGARLDGNGASSFELYDNSPNNASTSTPAGALNDGDWHNVVYTRSGTTLDAYLDGVLVGTTHSAGPANIVGQHPFVIGTSLPQCYDYPGFNFFSIQAAYDDVRTYSRALDQCDVSALVGPYAGTPATGLPPNYCAPTNPCQNGGTCTSGATGPVCQCAFPYTGADCSGPPPACPCAADPTWFYAPSDPEVECYVDYETPTSLYYALYDANYNGPYLDAYYNYCGTTNNYLPNLTPAQVQACVTSLLAIDAAGPNLCGGCTSQACSSFCTNNPGGQDDGNSCF